MGRGQRWNPAKLRALRQAFGLSPEAFASKIGRISGSTVRRWESGRHVPLIRQLEAIADACDVDRAVFFEPSNPTRKPRPRGMRSDVLPGQFELLPPRARGGT